MQSIPRSTAAALFSASRPFDRPFQEHAFRGEYLRAGREVALLLLPVGAAVALLAGMLMTPAGSLAFWLSMAMAAVCAAGALALAGSRHHSWRAYRRAVLIPLMVCGGSLGLLASLPQAAGGAQPHEPAILVLAAATVALLCRLLMAELVTLVAAVGALMLITMVLTAPSIDPAASLSVIAAAALAIVLANRIEARERESWRTSSSLRYELRRVRRSRGALPGRGPVARPAPADAFDQESATADVDVTALVRDVVAGHAAAATHAGVELVLAARSPDRALARTHAAGLSQVLGSVVSNAVRYGSLGGAPRRRVLVSVTPFTDEIRLSVLDNGVGIPADLHRRVFDAYFRAPAVAHRTAGAGLGLYLAARIIQRLDGHRLQLRSAPLRGTRVNIHVPRAGSVADARRAARQADPQAAGSLGR